MNTKTLLCCLPLALAACSSVERVDPNSDDAVTTMGVDYDELTEWSDTLTRRMLDSRFLDDPALGEQPIRMVVSKIENKTDLSNFPTEIVMGQIRSALLQSSKVRFVSTYGDDMQDRMTRETQDMADDPMFDQSQIPEQGQASVARLSLRTQILWQYGQSSSAKQNTYQVRMSVTDVKNGEVVWEDLSEPIAKKYTKGGLRW